MNTKTRNMIALFDRLRDLGFTLEEAAALRRIEMTLHRWAEQECGDSNDYCSWAIERDTDSKAICTQCKHKWYGETAETHNCPKCGDCAPIRHKATGKPYRCVYPHSASCKPRRTPIPDRETGALRRLEKIVRQRNARFFERNGKSFKDAVRAYHQTDPRGCALYIVRNSDLSDGLSIDSCYTRGIAVAA